MQITDTLTNVVPTDIGNLITSFAYDRDMKQVDERIEYAKQTISLPVPKSWLRFYTCVACYIELDWSSILDFKYSHALDMNSVADTVKMINWSLLKQKRTTMSYMVCRFTKSEIIYTLRNWRRCTNPQLLRDIVNSVWLILLGCFSLLKSARIGTIENINNSTNINVSDLIMYIRSTNINFNLYPSKQGKNVMERLAFI